MPRTRIECFPEEYLSKSEDDLVIELYHRREEEKRRKEAEELAEKEAKEREEEEAKKNRYQMFLKLKGEFETNSHLSIEEVLQIGRDLQNADKWHGAQYETVKLICDTIEQLQEELLAIKNKWNKHGSESD